MVQLEPFPLKFLVCLLSAFGVKANCVNQERCGFNIESGGNCWFRILSRCSPKDQIMITDSNDPSFFGIFKTWDWYRCPVSSLETECSEESIGILRDDHSLSWEVDGPEGVSWFDGHWNTSDHVDWSDGGVDEHELHGYLLISPHRNRLMIDNN